jgi:hypothetical protein
MSSVYDRLTDPKGYTGVYAKRFEGDGRINHHTDQSMSNGKQSAPARFLTRNYVLTCELWRGAH